MYWVFTCIYVCALHSYFVSSQPEEGVITGATGVTNGYELPQGCCQLNPCPLEEQPMLTPMSYLSSPRSCSFLTNDIYPYLNCLFRA